jgi:hypothetical protein
MAENCPLANSPGKTVMAESKRGKYRGGEGTAFTELDQSSHNRTSGPAH